MVQCTPFEPACEVIARVFSQVSKDKCVEIALMCWGLWDRRNKWVWERANGSVFGVRQKASHHLREWKEAQLKIVDSRGELGTRIWRPPMEGWLKINVDAAVFLDGSIGVAAVVRDDRANFVAAKGVRVAGAWSPREAEAIGFKEALSWIIGRGYSSCVFETDSYALVKACKGTPGEAYFGTIVRDSIKMLKQLITLILC